MQECTNYLFAKIPICMINTLTNGEKEQRCRTMSIIIHQNTTTTKSRFILRKTESNFHCKE